MDKKKILENLKNTYCRLRPSAISGVGVFAVRDIAKGADVFRCDQNEKWFTFFMSELDFLDEEVKEMLEDFFVIEKDKTVRVSEKAFNNLDISFYVNHSNQPNLDTPDNGFTFVANRNIGKGEELTVSYSNYDYKYKK